MVDPWKRPLSLNLPTELKFIYEEFPLYDVGIKLNDLAANLALFSRLSAVADCVSHLEREIVIIDKLYSKAKDLTSQNAVLRVATDLLQQLDIFQLACEVIDEARRKLKPAVDKQNLLRNNSDKRKNHRNNNNNNNLLQHNNNNTKFKPKNKNNKIDIKYSPIRPPLTSLTKPKLTIDSNKYNGEITEYPSGPEPDYTTPLKQTNTILESSFTITHAPNNPCPVCVGFPVCPLSLSLLFAHSLSSFWFAFSQVHFCVSKSLH